MGTQCLFVKTYPTVCFWPVHFILCKLHLNRKKSGKSKNRSGGSHVSITVTDSFRGCEENAYEFNVLIKKTHLRCPWEITPVTLLMLEFETYVRSNAVND